MIVSFDKEVIFVSIVGVVGSLSSSIGFGGGLKDFSSSGDNGFSVL